MYICLKILVIRTYRLNIMLFAPTISIQLVIFFLLMKYLSQMLDTLLTTLMRELQNDNIPGRIQEATEVARRFVRSVARIFVIFSVEMAPTTSKRRG